MTKSPKRPRDPNQLAKLITDIATGDASEHDVPERRKKLSDDQVRQKAE
jgi:hypothetical protein